MYPLITPVREYNVAKPLQEGNMAHLASAKHMLNGVYGISGNVPKQTTVIEQMMDIWKNGCQDPLTSKMSYADCYQLYFKNKRE